MTFPSFHHLQKRVSEIFMINMELFLYFMRHLKMIAWRRQRHNKNGCNFKKFLFLFLPSFRWIFFCSFKWAKLRSVSRSRLRLNIVTYKWILLQMFLYFISQKSLNRVDSSSCSFSSLLLCFKEKNIKRIAFHAENPYLSGLNFFVKFTPTQSVFSWHSSFPRGS